MVLRSRGLTDPVDRAAMKAMDLNELGQRSALRARKGLEERCSGRHRARRRQSQGAAAEQESASASAPATADIGGKSQREGREKDAGIEGGGVGGAMMVEPKAFVVVGEDGVPHMLALKRGKTAVLRHGVEIGPADGNSRHASPAQRAAAARRQSEEVAGSQRGVDTRDRRSVAARDRGGVARAVRAAQAGRERAGPRRSERRLGARGRRDSSDRWSRAASVRAA